MFQPNIKLTKRYPVSADGKYKVYADIMNPHKFVGTAPDNCTAPACGLPAAQHIPYLVIACTGDITTDSKSMNDSLKDYLGIIQAQSTTDGYAGYLFIDIDSGRQINK